MNVKQIQLIQRAFDYDYAIEVDFNDDVSNVSEVYINDLFNLNDNYEPSLFDCNIYNKLLSSSYYHAEFVSSLKMAIDLEEPKLLALNSEITINSRFKIPCIKLYLLITKIDLTSKTKTLYLYNWIHIAKQLEFYAAMMTKSLLQTTRVFKGNLITKSVYFAYTALKHFAGFLPSHKIEYNNQDYLAELLTNFHGYKNSTNTKYQKQRLFKHDAGYIHADKYKFSCEISQELINKLASMPVIPFNQLNENIILSI